MPNIIRFREIQEHKYICRTNEGESVLKSFWKSFLEAFKILSLQFYYIISSLWIQFNINDIKFCFNISSKLRLDQRYNFLNVFFSKNILLLSYLASIIQIHIHSMQKFSSSIKSKSDLIHSFICHSNFEII